MLKNTVATLKHPYYRARVEDWTLWRDTYEGGKNFILKYLEKFSAREGEPAFAKRKKISYNPAFAKEAIDEIKNSLFLRFVDITRTGGSQSYSRAIKGLDDGVDLFGSSMDNYIGCKVLPELLTMSKVGIFVDMPAIENKTLAEDKNAHPYLYLYPVESLCNWTYSDNTQKEFSNVLLQDAYFTYDDETGLPVGESTRYRRMWLKDGGVAVQYYNTAGEKVDFYNVINDNSIIMLNIPKIPFCIIEISNSLLAEVARYQVALMNLASSDIVYALQSNYPFYTEMYDVRSEGSGFIRPAGVDEGGQAADAATSKPEEITVGSTKGRRYGRGLDRPGFIHPSSEPLQASMAKQQQMKDEIRMLVNLSLASLSPLKASAESKTMDRQGLESGLAYIGLALEQAERQIAEYWAMYEKSKPATIFYPESYSIKTEIERREEAKELTELLPIVPSQEYRKAISKKIAELTVGRSVTTEQLNKIRKEIDESKAMTTDTETIAKHVELGLVDLNTASEACGYPKGSVDKAADDHADRLSRIAANQAPKNGLVNGAARGVPDAGANPNGGGSDEKKAAKDTTKDDVVKDKTRGEGK